MYNKKLVRYFLGLILVFLYNAKSFADACPNISGTYLPGEKIYISFEQTDCTSLIKKIGPLAEDGTIRGGFGDTYNLDGNPVCNSAGACSAATARPESIEFSLNFNGSVKTDDHGTCNHRGYQLSNDSEGNLVVEFPVFACPDGFQGTVIKNYPRH